mmetsp:Transcript_42512/g.135049  ORF Transcript_42512/g.135049 Transcript_42512/m.135049 type:complete len:235 (+) Transcript_42512:280-984(+)
MAQWLRTSGSEATFSRCSWSMELSGQPLSFSISRSFFCSARTRRRTASLSPRSMTFGFGPWRLGAGGGGGSAPLLSLALRSLCSMRSARGVASGRSIWCSRQKRRASSRQLSPARHSRRWQPQAELTSKTRRSGWSSVSASASSFAREARTSASAVTFSLCGWSKLSRPLALSRSISLSRSCRALARRLTVSLSRSSTSRMAAPASVPRRISGGGGGKSGAGKSPGAAGRQSAA